MKEFTNYLLVISKSIENIPEKERNPLQSLFVNEISQGKNTMGIGVNYLVHKPELFENLNLQESAQTLLLDLDFEKYGLDKNGKPLKKNKKTKEGNGDDDASPIWAGRVINTSNDDVEISFLDGIALPNPDKGSDPITALILDIDVDEFENELKRRKILVNPNKK